MSNYKKIVDDLDSLKDYCSEMAREQPRASWKQDIDTLQEAMDIVSDYEKVAVNEARMSQHYEMTAKPIHKNGIWTCPACGKKIPYHHSYCHWCGKKIGWKNR